MNIARRETAWPCTRVDDLIAAEVGTDGAEADVPTAVTGADRAAGQVPVATSP